MIESVFYKFLQNKKNNLIDNHIAKVIEIKKIKIKYTSELNLELDIKNKNNITRKSNNLLFCSNKTLSEIIKGST